MMSDITYAIEILQIEYYKQVSFLKEIEDSQVRIMAGHPDRERVQNRIKGLTSALAYLEEMRKEDKEIMSDYESAYKSLEIMNELKKENAVFRAEIERKDALINQALYYVDQNDIGGIEYVLEKALSTEEVNDE
jgi:hypothetical protein